ncbi:MAG: hypothetical protein JM58_12225 [Peptococcaceae bacterium BICA1-8]|nr:MAG: hypothetical protein JM58_12225 [Peptococcaceae bacterium BICA1-8]
MNLKDFMKDLDAQGYKASGHGQRLGFGKKTALIIVDMIKLYADPEFSLAQGKNMENVIDSNQKLLQVARDLNIPVFFANAGPRSTAVEKGLWGEKVGGAKGVSIEASQVIKQLAPVEGEIIVTKPKASGFFCTDLSGMLQYLGVDTIIVTGVTTSGCVRATVVDGFSQNFRVIIPEECVGDRIEISHLNSLYDMNMKYGDVMSLEEVFENLKINERK